MAGPDRATADIDDRGVRPGRPDDLPFLVACARSAYADYIPLIGREPAPMTADYGAALARGTVTVLEADRGPAGFGPAGFAVAFPKTGAWFLETVAVQPDSQGRGFGRRLIEAVERAGRARGLARIVLYTNAAMAQPLRLYPRLGYRRTGVVQEAGFHRVYFEKPLTDAALAGR